MIRLLIVVIAAMVVLLGVKDRHIAALKLRAQEAETAAVREERDRAEALNQEVNDLAQTNQDLATTVAKLSDQAHEAEQQLAAAVADADAERVRHRYELATTIKRLQAQARSAYSAGEREASASAIGVLADVYERADEFAGVCAATADRARLAGLTCERAYDALTTRLGQ